jgi:two-component system cell cycle response regulator
MNVVVAHTDPGARRDLLAPLERVGYDVVEAGTAEQALEACRSTRPDVALLSVGLGVSLLGALKADPDAYGTAVVLVAGREMPDDEAIAHLQHGAQDFLVEPVVGAEVVARVHAASRTKILQEELVGQTRRLETMLHEDALTGLFNRRYVLTRLAGLISGARRHGRPLSVVMVDVDHFKSVNDSHGHDVGDAALVATTIAMRERLRAEDELGRLGGEEFLALLPDADERAAEVVAESLRANVERARARIGGIELGVTISVGWATWNGQEEADGLVQRADRALFAAKEAGRNTVRGAENRSASLPRRT